MQKYPLRKEQQKQQPKRTKACLGPFVNSLIIKNTVKPLEFLIENQALEIHL